MSQFDGEHLHPGLPWWLSSKESFWMWVRPLVLEDPLEKEMATHPSILFFFKVIFYFIYYYFLPLGWLLFIYLFSLIFISWRLITLQYCSGFCHTLTWISHGVTCIPHSLQYSCLGIPMDRGAWQAVVCGVMKSRHELLNNSNNKSWPHSKIPRRAGADEKLLLIAAAVV